MQAIVVVNAGSSSLKVAVYGCQGPEPSLLSRCRVETATAGQASFSASGDSATADLSPKEATDGSFGYVEDWLRREHPGLSIAAYGHRVVHGGERFAGPVRIDKEVLAALHELAELAPLHQPHNLAAIRAVAEHSPQLPQVACFDTAFHRGHEEVVDRFALPERFHRAGIRRYGFHGLSYESIASSLPLIAPRIAAGRVVVAHLGNGASLCAMHAGRSVDTTMGFSALDGLIMGTRCGTLDPGVLLHLLTAGGMSTAELEELLYTKSGLLGLSGFSSDMRELLSSSQAGARLAVDAFVRRIQRELGAMAAVLGGIDGIVFTGGIGENSAEIRARICRGCSWLGLTLDEDRNEGGGPCISSDGSAVAAWVIGTDEESVIARQVMRTLSAES
ncbi:MAG TPA: acetate/propionate family kinase [Candidatus Binatia bacterium]|nr:acetate/propionate family kinase [Candidatus Binatia bacterium]